MSRMKARAKPIQINRKQVAPEVAPPMISAPNERRERERFPFMLLSLGKKMQVYCSLVVVAFSHSGADLSVAAVSAEERRQSQITGSHKAKKTQLAGRNLPP